MGNLVGREELNVNVPALWELKVKSEVDWILNIVKITGVLVGYVYKMGMNR